MTCFRGVSLLSCILNSIIDGQIKINYSSGTDPAQIQYQMHMATTVEDSIPNLSLATFNRVHLKFQKQVSHESHAFKNTDKPLNNGKPRDP